MVRLFGRLVNDNILKLYRYDLKNGFPIVTGPQAVSSKRSPRQAADCKVSVLLVTKGGSQYLFIDTKMSNELV
jgi:hypothetical protein